MSSLVGFVTGSLGSVWPWKSINYDKNIGSLFLDQIIIFFTILTT